MGGYAEILIAFAMVALLGLILRFTFGRELSGGADELRLHRRADDGTFDLDDDAFVVTSEDPAPTGTVAAPLPPSGDDFGLLSPVAVTDDEGQAHRLRARLGEANIRATTTRGRDGRFRVLVFSSELDHARRVAGGAA
jgi:hypothetical protein